MKKRHLSLAMCITFILLVTASCMQETTSSTEDGFGNSSDNQEELVGEASSAISTCSVDCPGCPKLSCSGNSCSADQSMNSVTCDGITYTCPTQVESQYFFEGCNISPCLSKANNKGKYVLYTRVCGGAWQPQNNYICGSCTEYDP